MRANPTMVKQTNKNRMIMKHKYIIFSIVFLLQFFSCAEEQRVEFSNDTTIQSIQVQKFDYISKIGVGKIYQGVYSSNKDTIYFDVTYYPDETPPSYEDWQIVATLPPGARITPGLSGIKNMENPLTYKIIAADGKTTSEVVLKMRIYEIPFGELEHGFGRYYKLWNKKADELGGWTSNNQTTLAVIGDELIVNNRNNDLLVYDKITGTKKDKLVPLLEVDGKTDIIFAITVDNNSMLHGASFVNLKNEDAIFRIYRWNNGLDQVPEIFFELKHEDIKPTINTGIGRSISIFGDTHKYAQIMVALDGEGTQDNRIARIAVENGTPRLAEIFNESTMTWPWRAKGIPVSETSRIPYFAMHLGAPMNLVYHHTTGTYKFVTAANKSNFLNKLASGAYYFEFNNAKYLAVSTASWSNDLRLLIFNVDDPTLIPTDKSTDPNTYNILNPFCQDWDFQGAVNGNGTGDVTVQVAEDGKSAYVYMLDTNSGILGYKLTNEQ